ADRRILIRRATLELNGLPPTPEEIAQFVDDEREGRVAFAKVVDRLLTSSAFGERWGRHWLDVARYAESSGYSRNMLYPLAWRWRNYVIDSLNQDKPFDLFIREQVAGDLLPASSQEDADAKIIATGFLTIGPKTLNEGNPLLFHLNVADDQIDATCRAFLALTANCARCHDHKYDPIPTRDYYALAGIFLSSKNLAGAATNVRNEHEGTYPLGPDGKKLEAERETMRKKWENRRKVYIDFIKRRDELKKKLAAAKGDEKARLDEELKPLQAQVSALSKEVSELNRAIPDPPPSAMAVIEGEMPLEGKDANATKKEGDDGKKPLPVYLADSPLYERGNHESPLDPVPRGVPTLFGYGGPPIEKNESGRLQLAQWLTDDRNPLTARVLANRVWHHIFGKGLVETIDNFGVLGGKPSHPELLNDLATHLVKDGWSVKRLIRKIMLSRTYMMSSRHDPEAAATDPANHLLWRFSPQPLEGEVIGDSILFVGGQLAMERPDGSQVATIAAAKDFAKQREIGRRDYYTKEVNFKVNCRSVYLPFARGALPDALAVFDAADPNLVVGARKLTTVPTQALFLMNSPLVIEQSRHLAKRILAHPDERRLGHAYEVTLGRPATAKESKLVEEFLASGSGTPAENWAQVCQTLICSGEFRTLY
ncbi:MAG: DUF1553 domain-containing protein, partial [Opitutales bacterium]